MRRLLLALPLLAAAASQAAVEWTVHPDPSHFYELSLTDEAVWGAGRGGVLRLDRATGGVSFLRTTDGLPVNDLGSVLAVSEEEIWLGSLGEGLLRYRPGEAEPWKRYQVLPQGMAGDDILSLALGPQGRVWYGSGDGLGVMEENGPGQIWTAWEGLTDLTVRALAFAGDTLLAGTPSGLFRMPLGGAMSYESEGPETEVEQIAVAGGWVFLLSDGQVLGRSQSNLDWSVLELPAEVDAYRPVALAPGGGELYVTLRRSGLPPEVWSFEPQAAAWTDRGEGAPDPEWSPDYAAPYFRALAVASPDEFYLGGEIYKGFGPGIWKGGGGEWTVRLLDQGPMGAQSKSLAFGPSGRLWTGSDAGAASLDPLTGQWTRFRRLQDYDYWPSWSIDLLEDRQGWVWFCHYSRWFARMSLADGVIETIPIGPEGASSDQVVAMGEDALGRRWFCSDDLGISVLDENEVWHQFSSSVGGLPADAVDNLAFISANRVALLFRGTGLAVWDHGGSLDVFTDDQWWTLGSGIDDDHGQLLTDTTGGALAADASRIWAGQADGLVLLGKLGNEYAVIDHLGKATFGSPGLLHSDVNDLAWESYGSVWAATEGGLSHLNFDPEEGWTVRNWTTEAGREEAGAELFGREVLAPLPDAPLWRVALHPDGDRVFVASNWAGLAELRITPDPDPAGEALDSAYLYPNPARGDLGHNAIWCGGIDFAIDLSIYNLEGQLVHEQQDLPPGEPLWQGLGTRFGNRAASGVYLVRMEYRGRVIQRELVIVR